MVFRRDEAEPGLVVLRRRTGTGGWQGVTAARFRAEVSALARLRASSATATTEHRHRVLRALVQDILIGPDK